MIFLFAFSANASANVFSDTEGHWAKYSIDYVTNEGYFVGTSVDSFSPDTAMTRGMFVTVLARISNEDISRYENKVFKDVHSGDYYAPSVAWAHANHIVAGTGETTFAPNTPVTREQICLMLKNYFNYAGITPGENGSSANYKDDKKISSWAYDAVYFMQKTGYLIGSDGNFRPQNNATRAECASVVSRVCGNFYGNYTPEDDEEGVIVPDDDPESDSEGTLVGEFTGTFYCPCDACNGGWGGMTATGAPMVVGETIAVDPSVIPLGSSVYIEFARADLQHLNGVYKATDTGGAIKGFRVDVLVENCTVAKAYGVDNSVKIYLLD